MCQLSKIADQFSALPEITSFVNLKPSNIDKPESLRQPLHILSNPKSHRHKLGQCHFSRFPLSAETHTVYN